MINYARYMEGMNGLLDNSGMLLLDILKESGIKNVAIAGFDGYEGQIVEYCDDTIKGVQSEKVFDEINEKVIEYLKGYSRVVKLEFITPSLYEERLNNEKV